MNATQPCSIDGCERPRKYAKTGWCQTHYHRWWRNGDTSAVKVAGLKEDPYELSYRGMHTRVSSLWGKANEYPCAMCDAPAREWAYDGTDPTAKDELIAGKWPVRFSVFPEFYFPACFPCHRALDAGARAARRKRCSYGHALTPENVYTAPSKPGSRECKTCRKTASAERYLRRRAVRSSSETRAHQ